MRILPSNFKNSIHSGGGTIQVLSSELFVTASPNGDMPITAARETVGSYEVFRWTPQADQTYTLTAMVNRAEVTTSAGEGQLINNANSTNGIPAGRYRLVPTDNAPPVDLPPTATIRSVENTRYVVATAGAPTLMTTSPDVGGATRWAFAKVEESPEASPYYTIQNLDTQQYVTGNMAGTVPLSATAPAPQAWEHFQVVAYQGSYILIHVASGHPVASQADDTLIDNTTTINGSTLWAIAA